MKYCRICAAPTSDPDAWVDLRELGRFWLCPPHMTNASFVKLDMGGYLYLGRHDGERVLVGPYPYEAAPGG